MAASARTANGQSIGLKACNGVRVKLFRPACILIPSNSTGLKPGVVELFPDTQKFQWVSIAQPVASEVVTVIIGFVAGNVRERNVVIIPLQVFHNTRAVHKPPAGNGKMP